MPIAFTSGAGGARAIWLAANSATYLASSSARTPAAAGAIARIARPSAVSISIAKGLGAPNGFRVADGPACKILICLEFMTCSCCDSGVRRAKRMDGGWAFATHSQTVLPAKSGALRHVATCAGIEAL
jgi:hypothetical protein